jgi:uncharacterized phage protein (TIGR01671 family)
MTNRAILFRVWLDKDRVSDEELKDYGIPRMIEQIGLDDLDSGIILKSPMCFHIHEAEIMQYIGLTDLNGIKIYEGDVITQVMPGDKTGILGVVEFARNTASFKINDGGIYYQDIISLAQLEVVGNIYEHPHLIPKR